MLFRSCPLMLNPLTGRSSNNLSHTSLGLELKTHTSTVTHIPTDTLTSQAHSLKHKHTQNNTRTYNHKHTHFLHSQRALPWQHISSSPLPSQTIVILIVCQWKLICRLNALHPWVNYHLSGSRYVDHDNPTAEGLRRQGEGRRGERRGEWGAGCTFKGELKFLTFILWTGY